MPVLPAADPPASPPIKTHVRLSKPHYSLPMISSGGGTFNCLHDASRPLDMTVLGINVDSALSTITCALCRFRQQTTTTPLFVELSSHSRYPLDQADAQHTDRIIHAECSREKDLPEAGAQLTHVLSSTRLGQLFADAAATFCRQQDIEMSAVSAISVQGQAHQPDCTAAERAVRSALTLAEASVLAEHTGATCISNLTSSELVVTPSASLDALLLRHPARTRLCQYMGRTHTSYCLVPASNNAGHLDAVTEATAEPGTSLIDDVVRHYTNNAQQHDADGAMAAAGTVNAALADRFLHATRPAGAAAATAADPPSTGAPATPPALHAQDLLDQAAAAALSGPDAVATATHIVSQAMLAALTARARAPHVDEILLCGGAARNPHLVRALASAHPGATLMPLESVGLPGTARAAAATAWRGVEALVGRVPRCHIIPGRGYRTVMRGAMAFGGPEEELPPVREAVRVVNDAPVNGGL